jgi:hypothetical protein
MAAKMLSRGKLLMSIKFTNRAIATVQVINWAAIIIGMGLILTVVGAGIIESLANTH